MQAAVETIDGFIVSMMDENVGPNGRRFVPLIFSIFIFVLALNILGLIPWVGAFTPTSHVAVTLALAFIIFGIVLIVGFWKHGLHFFTLFWPKGRSEEHTSELQSLMRTSYAVFCLKKKTEDCDKRIVRLTLLLV